MTLIFIVFLACTLLQLMWLLGFFSHLARYAPVVNQEKQPSRVTGPTLTFQLADHTADFLADPENHHSTTHASHEQVSTAKAVSGPPSVSVVEGVSVIICARNELENLRKLLPKLKSQDHPRFEVILVDDRSTDGTKSWLKQLMIDWPKLKYLQVSQVPQGTNPKKHALVQGINTASHDILLLTDADCLPVSNFWIRSMAEKCHNGTKIVLGYSGYEKRPGLLNRLIRYETVLTAIQYFSRALAGKPYMGVGRNLCYRKEFFKHRGGLSEVMHITGGDDDLFVNRNAHGGNTAVNLEANAKTISKPKTRWKDYSRQKKRHLSVGKHYKAADKWVLGIFSLTHIIFWSSLVSLLIASMSVNWVAAGFVIRQLALSWIVRNSSSKLGESISFFQLPLLDFCYSLTYLYTGLVALSGTKINWD